MRIITLVKTISFYSETIDAANTGVVLTNSARQHPVCSFSRGENNLDMVEIGEASNLELLYADRLLTVKVQSDTIYQVSPGNQSCFLVAHHWGRGVNLSFNGKAPGLRILQIGFKKDWLLVHKQPCIYLTSGGSDPIKDLVKCFFEVGNKFAEEFIELQNQLKTCS